MRDKQVKFWLILFFIVYVSESVAGYSAQDFFVASKLEDISAEEAISKKEKEHIINTEFAITKDSSSPFAVMSNEPYRLELRSVDIHLYPVENGGYVISVTSILGNHGQSQYISFYQISEDGHIVQSLDFKDVGLTQVLSNEFLDEKQYFSDSNNFPVNLYINEDGSIDASPWTWMSPEWEFREIVNQIKFVWTGKQFTKEVTSVVK
ncbi:hypothetical protein [Photobacterium nomapromontoriensis]|uniref:hypothetical protein n=1 Tax=Photobacterium nomapromontoriensis TaxID=2910237 RepID=UPI003D0BBB95